MLVKLDGIALEEELIHQEYDSGHGKAYYHSHKQVARVMYSEIGAGVTDYCSHIIRNILSFLLRARYMAKNAAPHELAEWEEGKPYLPPR